MVCYNEYMRSFDRFALILVLATAFSLSLRLVEDNVASNIRFHWPYGWNATPGNTYILSSAPGKRQSSVIVRGFIYQSIQLVNGRFRPLRVTFKYRSPMGAAAFGVAGDATSQKELDIKSAPSLPVPEQPDSNGEYVVILPPAPSWKDVTLDINERSDIPWLTLYLQGSYGELSQFCDVSCRYQDGGEGELVTNGTFQDPWPGWVVHPEWLTLASGIWTPSGIERLLTDTPRWVNGPWYFTTPAHTVLILFIFFGLVALRLDRKAPSDHKTRWFSTAWWVCGSALIALGVAGLSDLMAALFAQRVPPSPWFAPTSVLSGAVQIGVYIALGWMGSAWLGRSALKTGWIISPLTGLMMTAATGLIQQTGRPTPRIDWRLFEDWLGVLWILAGCAAVIAGVYLRGHLSQRGGLTTALSGSSRTDSHLKSNKTRRATRKAATVQDSEQR